MLAGLELPHAPVEIPKQRMSKNFLQTIPKLIIRTADDQDSFWIARGHVIPPSLSAHARRLKECNPASKKLRQGPRLLLLLFGQSFLRLISQGDRDKFSLPSPKVHPGQFPKAVPDAWPCLRKSTSLNGYVSNWIETRSLPDTY